MKIRAESNRAASNVGNNGSLAKKNVHDLTKRRIGMSRGGK